VDLVAEKNKELWIFEVKRRKEISSRQKPLVSFSQKKRLQNAALWIWQKKRKNYVTVRCRLIVVTECGIRSITLPLLYDHC
jgi:Holliday junction resolvase-like predicted endonuclease